jgi:hypothetical protein
MKREDNWNARLVLDGRNLGVWDKTDGGEVDADTTSYKLGGTDEFTDLGGPAKTGNLTMERLYDEAAHSVYHWLTGLVGKSKKNGRGVATVQPLDDDGNAFGRPIVYRINVKKVGRPSTDSNGSGASLLTLELTVVGKPS